MTDTATAAVEADEPDAETETVEADAPAFTYQVKTGKFFAVDGDLLAVGYSGLGDAKNKTDSEKDKGKGPIPRGDYSIGHRYDSNRVGPFALPLEPLGHTAFGRSAFRIHGDSIKHPGTASHGCIIVPRSVREHIANSGVQLLHVI